jgi:peptidoglycan/xylan/chitin deacetylase (PgdA/CDA1 family)
MMRSGGLILCYHRVLPVLPEDPHGVLNPFDLVTETAHFRAHMEILRERFTLVPLEDLLRQLVAGHLEPGQACVTFDDGYFDNFLSAFPILRALAIPATVFLVTGYLEREQPFWWMRLTRLLHLITSHVLPVPPELGGGCLALRGRRARRQAYLTLLRRLRVLPNADTREHLLDALGAQGTPVEECPLTWEECRKMQAHGIHFAPHSCSHPSLVALPEEVLLREVSESVDTIRLRLGVDPQAFSYPYGHVDARVSRAVQDAGLAGAVTAGPLHRRNRLLSSPSDRRGELAPRLLPAGDERPGGIGHRGDGLGPTERADPRSLASGLGCALLGCSPARTTGGVA